MIDGGLEFVFAAYAVTLAALGVYAWSLQERASRVSPRSASPGGGVPRSEDEFRR